MMENEELTKQARANDESQFVQSPRFETEMLDCLISSMDSHRAMTTKLLNDDKLRQRFKELLANTAGVVELTGQTALCSVTGASSTEKGANVLAQVDNLINAMSSNVYDRDDIIIFMSQTQFKCYLTAVRTVNNFYIDSSENKLGSVYSVFHPQTNYKVVGVPGLNGSNLIVAAPSQYFLVGVDLTSDEDSFRAWWSQDFQEVRIMVSWKIGTQLAFPQFFVTNGLS
jgi:hypothetical protein